MKPIGFITIWQGGAILNKEDNHLLPDIKRTAVIDAPVKTVWKAVATSEGLSSWLMPNNFKPVMGYSFTLRAAPFGDWDGTVHCEVRNSTLRTGLALPGAAIIWSCMFHSN
jgi:hypothetical protein